jgi:poly-gamma-glutamate capsule biosynthesis protein CapA/YwtB (metallophosphatase superfamily)
MSRNRRNTRRNNRIKEFLTWRNFCIIIGILILIIIICIGINIGRSINSKIEIAKQQEELDKQSQQIFEEISESIEETNKNISESDSILRISAVGDILCSNDMLEDAYDKESKTYDFSHMFNNITNFVNKSDIVIGTMETGITNSNKYDEKNAPLEFAKAVRDSGVNLVTISHNHSLDNGVEGLQETRENLEKLDFDVVGQKKEDNCIIIKEIKQSKIAFLTYTCFLDNEEKLKKDEIQSVNIYSKKQAKSDIEYAKKQGAQYICVMIHWGDAISEVVNSEQKEIADYLVENGVNLIIGSHPSVVQPMEIKQNKEGENVFVAYSIGTYISTLSAKEARTELVLNIELRKSGKDGKIYLNKVDYTPIYMLDNGDKANNRFELMDMKNLAKSYKGDKTDKISKETYDDLIKGLNRLNKILNIEE